MIFQAKTQAEIFSIESDPRGETLARLGIGSVAGNREILVPLAKQLEDRHLSPMQITPPPDQGLNSIEVILT